MVKIAEILLTYSDEGETCDLRVWPSPAFHAAFSNWWCKCTTEDLSLFGCALSEQTPLDVLQEQCNTTSATNSHAVLQLEHAQSLLLQFSEGLAEVSPWLEETQTLVGHLSLSTISYEAFREQQELLQVKETCLSKLECQLFSSLFFSPPVQQRRSFTLSGLGKRVLLVMNGSFV